MFPTRLPGYRSRPSAATCGGSGAGRGRSRLSSEPMNIIERPFAEADRRKLMDSGMHPLLAKLYAARRIRSAEELDCGAARPHTPALMKSVEHAAALLADAIAARKRLLIIADYD